MSICVSNHVQLCYDLEEALHKRVSYCCSVFSILLAKVQHKFVFLTQRLSMVSAPGCFLEMMREHPIEVGIFLRLRKCTKDMS